MKVTLWYSEDEKDNVIYENVISVVTYPCAENSIKSYAILELHPTSTQRYKTYPHIYKKPKTIVVEEE
jgi:hypothetical protein